MTSSQRSRSFSELAKAFGMAPSVVSVQNFSASNVLAFKLPDWAINTRPAPAFANLPAESLADGLGPNIEEIRSALAAIPPSTIASEPEWMKVARAVAHEAAVHVRHTEQLWLLLDEASQRAPGYNQVGNRERYERYIREAFNRPDPITISTLYHLALQHGWSGQSAKTNAPSTAVAVTPGRAMPVSSLPLVPAHRPWLYGNDLIRGFVTLLIAAGGRAKTTLLILIALACASGRNLLGTHIFGGPLRVLFLSTEDGVQELALRVRAAMLHYGLTDSDLPDFHLIGADLWGFPLMRVDGNQAALDQVGMAALRQELDRLRPDVLIIDPLINLLGGVSVNDNAAAALLMRCLVELATTRKMSIVIAHHVSKNREIGSAESAMGAASYVNLSRIALSVEYLDQKDAGALGIPPWEVKNIFRLTTAKANLSQAKIGDEYYKVVSRSMPNAEPPVYTTGDQVAVIERFVPGQSGPAFPNNLLQDALALVDAASPPLTPSKRSTDRYAAPIIANSIKKHRGGQAEEADGKAVLDHLINVGLVAVIDVKVARSGSRADTRKGLALTAAGRVALQQAANSSEDSSPQRPQSPATTSQDDAGGDPAGTPQRKGGVGGNAGEMQTGAEGLNRSET